jgi:hypothetical protein
VDGLLISVIQEVGMSAVKQQKITEEFKLEIMSPAVVYEFG